MSSTKGKCQGCGEQKELTLGLCYLCDIEARAKEPPMELLDMRFVYEGRQPANQGQVILKQLLDKAPKEFLRLKREAEASYRESLFKKEEKEKVVEEKADEGSEKVVELIDKWLEEFNNEAGN